MQVPEPPMIFLTNKLCVVKYNLDQASCLRRKSLLLSNKNVSR